MAYEVDVALVKVRCVWLELDTLEFLDVGAIQSLFRRLFSVKNNLHRVAVWSFTRVVQIDDARYSRRSPLPGADIDGYPVFGPSTN